MDCSEYFQHLDPKTFPYRGTFAHSWHIGNPVFARDLALTLSGGMDRNVVTTRTRTGDGRLVLTDGARPLFWERWDEDSNG